MASAADAGRVQRLLVQSDQHIEQSYWELPRRLPPHDVAVFAGDLSSPLADSLEILRAEREAGIGLARDIVLVPGNHEYYGVEMGDALAEGRALARDLGIHLLDCDAAVIGGVRYLGATLWTDYELHGTPAASMHRAALEMNDHVHIALGAEPFRPSDARAIHRRHLAWLEASLSLRHPGPTVVVTHHCPSPGSIHRDFEGDGLNPAFASDLDRIMHRHAPAAWIHGHTHSSFDYAVGRTRVVCNPKGYGPGPGRGIENAAGFRDDLVVEIPLDGP